MSLTIGSIPALPAVAQAAAAAAPAPAASGTGEFASMLGSAIGGIENYRAQADQAVQKLVTGDGAELHNVALAVQRAELAFDLGLQIRNKVVDAYQEVMRMQL